MTNSGNKTHTLLDDLTHAGGCQEQTTQGWVNYVVIYLLGGSWVWLLLAMELLVARLVRDTASDIKGVLGLLGLVG